MKLTEKLYASDVFEAGINGKNVRGYEDVKNPLVPELNPHYVFNQTLLQDVLDFLDESFGDGLWLAGSTGTGKTSFIEQVAARLCIPCFTHTCGESDRFENLVGRWELIKGETVWLDGLLTQAMKSGGILLLNEMDTLLPSEFAQFNGITEGAPLIIDQLGSEVVYPSPNFRLIATGNSVGAGDNGYYAGVQTQNLASMDRFSVVNVPYIDADTELSIISKIVPNLPTDIITKMIKVANIVRSVHQGQNVDESLVTGNVDIDSNINLSVTLSTRTLIRWATKTVRMHSPDNITPIKYAFERSLLNRISDPAEREAVITYALAVFGESYDPEKYTSGSSKQDIPF